MLPTFPYSPLPAALQRTMDWGENIVQYDSGESQGDTPYLKPLLTWGVPIELMTEIKQTSLWQFALGTKGMVRPFLIKDAYEYLVGSVLAVNTGIISGSSKYITDKNGFMVRPDTLYVGSMFSSLSGYVTLGNEYTIDQDTGILTVNTKASGDYWHTNTPTQYFRKARFSTQYADNAKLWNIWTSNLSIVELP